MKDRQHDADEQHQAAEGHQRSGLLLQRTLDIGDDRLRVGVAGHSAQLRKRARALALQHEPARRIGNQRQQAEEDDRRNRFGGQHQAPAGRVQPVSVSLLGDVPVDEVHDEHATDDRQLVEGDELAANGAGSDLSDIQRREHRGDTDADATENAVENERPERLRAHLANGSEAQLRHGRADGSDQEQYRRDDQSAAPSERVREPAGNQPPDHAAPQRAGNREARKAARTRL